MASEAASHLVSKSARKKRESALLFRGGLGAGLEIADLCRAEVCAGIEAELEAGGFAHVVDESGAKAGDAGSAGAADAWINDTV